MDWLILLHAGISLAGTLSGLVLFLAMMGGRNLENWATWFLIFTILAGIIGFFARPLAPVQITNGLSLIAAVLAIYALYGRGLSGKWRRTYVLTIALALYLDMLVLVVQAFAKIPLLNAFTPGHSPGGSVFLITQLALLALFLLGGWIADRNFKPLKF